MTDANRRPHSPACVVRPHQHGTACSADCPFCHGIALQTFPVGPPPSALTDEELASIQARAFFSADSDDTVADIRVRIARTIADAAAARERENRPAVRITADQIIDWFESRSSSVIRYIVDHGLATIEGRAQDGVTE